MIAAIDKAAVRAALAEIPDPEIPVVSVVELGMIGDVDAAAGRIRVELLPTFVGCPAIEAIRSAVAVRLSAFGRPVDVDLSFRVPWTSERISSGGREKLRRSGFAPPGDETCPHCRSADVVLDSLFGPTQCRSIAWCRACRQPFERFKVV